LPPPAFELTSWTRGLHRRAWRLQAIFRDYANSHSSPPSALRVSNIHYEDCPPEPKPPLRNGSVRSKCARKVASEKFEHSRTDSGFGGRSMNWARTESGSLLPDLPGYWRAKLPWPIFIDGCGVPLPTSGPAISIPASRPKRQRPNRSPVDSRDQAPRIARKRGGRVRLFTRNGSSTGPTATPISEPVATLAPVSAVVDGEAGLRSYVVTDRFGRPTRTASELAKNAGLS
jgi:hypothetical protein